MRAIIMADGNATRWGNHRGAPKHLVEIDGETLLQRTVRLLRERGVDDIHITSHDPRYEVEGAIRYEPDHNLFEVDKFLAPKPIWSGETALVYGDVYFSEVAMDAIVSHESGDYTFFGRSTASAVTGKEWKEVFAVKFNDHATLDEACQSVRKLVATGGSVPSLIEPVGGAWHLYMVLTGHQAGANETDHFFEINDITEDFDYPDDLETWLKATDGKRSKAQVTIPRIFHTIWVGERPAPMVWIDTWQEKNPEWQHVLWDNDKVFGRKWRNQKHVDWFRERKMWAGVADVVRYEILHECGGFGAGADSICLEPIDELFSDPAFDAYTCYENEALLGDLCSPLLGCTKGNPLAKALIEMLGAKEVLGEPWKTTGNLFMMHAIKALEYPRLKIFPSHTLLPEHHSGAKYTGTGKVYANHMWGNGKNAYDLLDNQQKNHGK